MIIHEQPYSNRPYQYQSSKYCGTVKSCVFSIFASPITGDGVITGAYLPCGAVALEVVVLVVDAVLVCISSS